MQPYRETSEQDFSLKKTTGWIWNKTPLFFILCGMILSQLIFIIYLSFISNFIIVFLITYSLMCVVLLPFASKLQPLPKLDYNEDTREVEITVKKTKYGNNTEIYSAGYYDGNMSRIISEEGGSEKEAINKLKKRICKVTVNKVKILI